MTHIMDTKDARPDCLMIKRRPTDLSDEERERIAPLLRKPASGTLAEH
ncbi:hypothetical protein M5D98_31810 [Mesorhizobium opportunistum]|nr:hypothetical protein [Mesorhizobium opportunistum]UQS64586.1 hypothetical protein M5D98_31810 [Mesorhizobium opportunistum]